MKPFLPIFLFLALASTSVEAQPRRFNLPIDGFAATVNNQVITIGEVDAITRIDQERLRIQYSGPELATRQIEVFKTGLRRLIEDALIKEEFASLKGNMPDRVIQEEINAIIYNRFENNRAAFLQALAEDQITLTDFEDQIRNQIIIGEMRRSEVLSRATVSPRDVRRVYETERDRYRTPGQAHLRLIFMSAENTSPQDLLDQAREVHRRFTQGEATFAELAADVSQDPSATRGGDWGWIDPSILFDSLRTLVNDLPIGQISQPLETTDGIFIVLVEDRTDEIVKSFDDVRADIEADLRQQEIARRHEAWIERLRQKFYVRVFDGIPNPFTE
ncbi:MAG TPA: peptidylprolyl isomerase [Kiritimatiellia bacterium]|nr:peptidylprolyl isomerase [Kiritimatiellia bacterium]